MDKMNVLKAGLGVMALASLCVAQDKSKAPENYGVEAALQSVAKMTVAEGLEVSLFAAEPMVQNPTAMDVDARGRVWITEAANYRKWANPPIRPEGDRVMTLEDTDGDGRADKATVFYQDPSVDSALGIAVFGDEVIVSVAPNVFVLRDTDGDGKADQRRLLLTGTAGRQHDHSFHSFVHGTDGRLYFNFGNTGSHYRRPTGKLLNVPLHGAISLDDVKENSEPITDLTGNVIEATRKPYQQGMVFRADYRDGQLTNFETLGNNFRNNYEAAPDSFGNLWQSDNDDDGNKGVRINYVMEHGSFGYSDELTGAAWQSKRPNIEKEIPLRHWHQNDPGTVPNLLQTGAGSPTGLLVNEGSALGQRFENQIIHCDAGPRVVRAYPVRKQGAGFTAEMVEILTSSDSWYRPSDVAIHPDGSLFVADWYDAGVGGHAMADNEVNALRGRVYRVASKGAKIGVPKVDLSTPEGAVAALRSPNKATQHVAYRALAAMGEKAVPALKGMFESNAPRMRARALALLARVPREANAALAAALQDKDSDVVIAGIRLATMLATSGELDTSVLENMPGLVGRLVGHADPAVRRQLAVSLHHAKQVEPMWAKLAAQHDGSDRWYLEALGIGARGIDDSCFDAWFAEVKGQWDTASGHDIVWRLRTPKVAPFLAKLILRNPPEQRYLRAFDFVPDSPERTDALLALAKDSTDVTVVAEALQRLVRTSAKDAPAVVSALEGALARTKGRAAYVDLVAAVGVGSRAGELLEAALQLRPAPEAMDAIRMLVKDAGGFSEIQSAIKRGQGDSVEAIFGMLGDSGLAKAVDLLASELKSAGTPERRSAAIRALARTQSGAEALVNMAKGGVFPSELRGVAASALAMVQYASLKDEISKQFPQAGALGGKPLPAVSELVKVKGDVAHGKEVFERAASSCVTCHKVGAKGVDFGPGLGAIGAKLPKEALYDAIINPNAGISMGFETSEVRLRSGGLAMGIVRSETQDEVVLVLPGGALQKVPRTDVQQIKKLTVSMMPSGLNQALTQQDLVDLVEYLSTLRDAK
jgi:putative membrane-bound dehydrogenase-like protein